MICRPLSPLCFVWTSYSPASITSAVPLIPPNVDKLRFFTRNTWTMTVARDGAMLLLKLQIRNQHEIAAGFIELVESHKATVG
jgi:hypothetical protein